MQKSSVRTSTATDGESDVGCEPLAARLGWLRAPIAPRHTGLSDQSIDAPSPSAGHSRLSGPARDVSDASRTSSPTPGYSAQHGLQAIASSACTILRRSISLCCSSFMKTTDSRSVGSVRGKNAMRGRTNPGHAPPIGPLSALSCGVQRRFTSRAIHAAGHAVSERPGIDDDPGRFAPLARTTGVRSRCFGCSAIAPDPTVSATAAHSDIFEKRT